MEVTLRLNRTEYIPGEEAVPSIHVRNPTSEILEIYDPLDESV